MPPKQRFALRLDAATVENAVPPSYQINCDHTLFLRAFLFANGSIYTREGGRELGTVHQEDIDESGTRAVGKGASGNVYTARLKSTGAPIALKKIFITSRTHRDEVERELTFFSTRSENPFVMQNYGAFWHPEDNAVVIPMEWMAYSLKDLCTFWGGLEESVLRDIFWQVLNAFQYLHGVKRLIHRDVKPSNILIRDDGYVKVGDFGVSKMVQTLDISSSFVGTMVFMAPERLDQTSYSFASDIWSLGLTMINAATGKPPWEVKANQSGAMYELLSNIAKGTVPSLPASYSKEAHDVVARCLERDPSKRASSEELLAMPFFNGCTEASCTNNVQAVVQHMTRLINANPMKDTLKTKEEQDAARIAKMEKLESLDE